LTSKLEAEALTFGAEGGADTEETLDLPYEEMEKRIGDPVKRGVAIPEGFTLKDLYEERTALYQKYAEYTLEEGNRTAEECLLELMRYLDSV